VTSLQLVGTQEETVSALLTLTGQYRFGTVLSSVIRQWRPRNTMVTIEVMFVVHASCFTDGDNLQEIHHVMWPG